MNDTLIIDSDFNNFYSNFIGKKKKNKESAAAESIPLDWSKGMVVGEYSPAQEPKKKGGAKLLSKAGDFITGDRALKVLDGISKGIEYREQFRNSSDNTQGGGFENAPSEDKGLSNTQIIGIAVGGIAVVGLVIYFITKV